MARFVPAKSRVVLSTPGRDPFWYTTREDVPVAVEPRTVRCPLREIDVLVVSYKGIDVYFQAGQLRTAYGAADIQRLRNLNLYKLEYDISNNRIADATRDTLIRIAIRTSKSCWLIPYDRMPWIQLDRLTEAGEIWNIIKQDVSEVGNLIDAAVLSLHTRVQQAISDAEDCRLRLEQDAAREAADPTADIAAVEKRFLSRAEGVQKRTAELLDNLKAAAGVFGLPLEVSAASTAAQAISQGMHQRARAYADAARKLREANTAESRAVAAQLETNQIPVGVAADYLDENVADGAAESLRAAFAEDDGTFSLADASDAA